MSNEKENHISGYLANLFRELPPLIEVETSCCLC